MAFMVCLVTASMFGIVDGGSRGVEMPAAAEEGCHGAYVIAAG